MIAAITALLVVFLAWFFFRRREEVACTLDLEATPEHFHAHVDLDGAVVWEGDVVRVHGAPERIGHGEKRTMRAHASIAHASALRRWWTRKIGTSEITSLYEVGFEG